MMPATTSRDVVVVGAGAIGLAVALELARRGVTVTVLDRGRAAGAATWAAAGMLAPLGEAAAPGPFLALAMESLGRYPDFVADVEGISGMDVPFRICGKLLVAVDEAGALRLEERHRWQSRAGFRVRRLGADEARRVEPALGSLVVSALHLPTDGVVDNRALGRALAEAAAQSGVELREGVEVEAIRSRGGGVAGVALAGGDDLHADVVVLAAGAWSGTIGGLPRRLPVRPVRGQMLALAAPGPPLRGLVGGTGAYLSPRGRGAEARILIGATEEEVGFTPGTEDRALEALRREAQAMVPALSSAPDVERWSGFRPGTPDDLPVLGPDPELDGLIYATGHFRNGILLAPVTARLVADAITGTAPAAILEAFRPDRFGAG